MAIYIKLQYRLPRASSSPDIAHPFVPPRALLGEMKVFDGGPMFAAAFVASGLAAARAVTAAGTQAAGGVDGLYALIQRRVPSHSTSFSFGLTPNNSALDTFILSDVDSLGGEGNSTQARINIQCTSISACARGLYT